MKADDGQRRTRRDRRILFFREIVSRGLLRARTPRRPRIRFSVKKSSASSVGSALLVVLTASVVGAQQQALTPPGDAAAVERGQRLHVQECGFCHGANARGGSSGPDLTRSALVQNDENGRQLGEFLQVGRPDRGMPRFDMPAAQVSDLAAFLHAAIYLDVEPPALQDPRHPGRRREGGRGVLQRRRAVRHLPFAGRRPQGRRRQVRAGRAAGAPADAARPRAPPGAPPVPLYAQPTAIKATVTPPSGETVTRRPRPADRLRRHDLRPRDRRSIRSWLRNGDVPKVVLTDPLQAHVDS